MLNQKVISLLFVVGFLAGGYFSDQGAPENHLCLVPHPIYESQGGPTYSLNSLYGSEYEISSNDPAAETTPACALCRSQRSSVAMFPGENIIIEGCYQILCWCNSKRTLISILICRVHRMCSRTISNSSSHYHLLCV
jgi:hypothetical protein